MASEAVGIKEELSIKKTTVDEKGAQKITLFYPDLGVSVEVPAGTTNEEGYKIAKNLQRKEEVK